jgi:hypothetical protein
MMSYFSINQVNNLYKKDFCLWTEATIQQLKESQFNDLDIPNLIEEIESIGQREKRELRSRLIILLMYLLKWHYQPEKRSNSWQITITEKRICIEELLEDSPSLQPLLLEVFAQCYQKACLKASEETGIKLNFFPKESPFTLEEVLQFSFLNKEIKIDETKGA